MLLPTSSPYCFCCCRRCCVGATPFFLYRLWCPILAPDVLLLCYVVGAEVLRFFRYSFTWNHPPPMLPGSPIFPPRSDELQTVPTFLHFVLLFTKICVFINIMVFPRPAGEGGGVETDGSPSSGFLCPPLPPPLSLPAIVRG